MVGVIAADYEKIGAQHGRGFLWTSWTFYSPVILAFQYMAHSRLEKDAGPFDVVPSRIESGQI
jgi:phosphatidylglycerol phospholipase C